MNKCSGCTSLKFFLSKSHNILPCSYLFTSNNERTVFSRAGLKKDVRSLVVGKGNKVCNLECPTRPLKTWKLETELEISSSSQVRFNHYQFQVFRFKTWRTRKFQVKSSLKSYKPEPEFFNHRSICDQTSDKSWWWCSKLSCFLKSFL